MQWWMNYLLFGISPILLFGIGCIRKVDYSLKAKWVYINETGYNITYYPNRSAFNVKPHDTTIYYQDDTGPKDISAEEYIPPLNAYIIFYDNIKCDTFKIGPNSNSDDGPLGTANYESKKLGTNNFEFTYRFTEEDYLNAQDCK
jgi:hypothetical protein